MISDSMDDHEDFIDDELKSPPRKTKCPSYCTVFKCLIDEKTGGNCREECKKLELTKSLVCEICTEDCEKERKMILLDTKYFDYMKTLKTENTTKKIDNVKTEYRAMEMRLQEVRDQFHMLPAWNVAGRNKLKEKSAKLKYKMTIYQEIMDYLGIEYEKNVDIS